MKRTLPSRATGRPAVIACLHLLPLPGSAGWTGSMAAILDQALRETRIFVDAGVDGLLIENTHDTPYLRRRAEAGTVAAMAVVAASLRAITQLPIGVQVLAGANQAALELAVATDLDFIRVEGFVYGHLADEGWMDADAAELVRRRAHLGAEHIEIWADVKKKHSSHALSADLSLRDIAEGAHYCRADGVIVTGGLTGQAASPGDLASVADLPLRTAVGSGITPKNVGAFREHADALIVGSAFKRDDDWRLPVEPERVQRLVASVIAPA